ncbi:hypothetical protein [Haladaptatus sp. NG-SE-30]
MLSSDDILVDRVIIANWDRTSGHTIYVSLDYEGETIYEKTYQFKSREGEVVPSVTITEELPDEAGTFVVSASMPSRDESLSRVNVGRSADGNCTIVEIHTFEQNRLGIAVGESCQSS